VLKPDTKPKPADVKPKPTTTTTPTTTSSPKPTAKPTSVTTTSPKPSPKVEIKQQLGGFQGVNIPLSSAAKSRVQELKKGDYTMIALSLNEAKTEFDCQKTSKTNLDGLGREIDPKLPRFYVIAVENSFAFIYCCPDASPPKDRMSYSSAKTHVESQLRDIGITLLPKTMEIRDGSEISASTLKSETAQKLDKSKVTGGMSPMAKGGNYVDGGETVKAKNIPRVPELNPLAKIMVGNSTLEGPKKKIVLPPRGAY